MQKVRLDTRAAQPAYPCYQVRMSDADTFRELWALLDAVPAVSRMQTPEEWKIAVSAAIDALIDEPEVKTQRIEKVVPNEKLGL